MRKVIFNDQIIEHAQIRLGAEAVRPQFVDCMFYNCTVAFAPEALPVRAPVFRRCWFENCEWVELQPAAFEDCRFYYSPPDAPPSFASRPAATDRLPAPPDDLPAPDAWI